MADTIPKYDWSNKGRKKMRLQKPYWNDIDIESSAAHNHDPNKFWNYIKRLGPERKKVFPA